MQEELLRAHQNVSCVAPGCRACCVHTPSNTGGRRFRPPPSRPATKFAAAAEPSVICTKDCGTHPSCALLLRTRTHSGSLRSTVSVSPAEHGRPRSCDGA